VLTGLIASRNSSTGGTFAAYAIFAYFIHRYFLLRVTVPLWGRAKSPRPETTGRFILVSLLVLAIPTGVGLWLAFSMANGAELSHDKEAMLTIFALTFVVLYWVGLSIFGTALPASAIGDPFGIGITLRRARLTFFRVFAGLLVGPGLFGLMTLIGDGYLLGQIGLPFDFRDASGAFSGIGLVIGSLLRILGLINTTLAIAVLCDAYKRVQVIRDPEPDANPA
jgi:hypothetical protein